jgi:hypothetical protein
MKSTSTIPVPSPSVTPVIVQNVEPPSKKAPPPITGLLMENFIVYPVVNLSTASSFQLQLMKKFTRESEIPLPFNKLDFFLSSPVLPGFFSYKLF